MQGRGRGPPAPPSSEHIQSLHLISERGYVMANFAFNLRLQAKVGRLTTVSDLALQGSV